MKLKSVGGGGNKNFIIETDGNVGIGTNNPHNLLDLGTRNGKKLAVFQNSAGEDFYGFGISTALLEFYAGAATGDSPGMVLRKASGNVGIGTTTPSHPLEMASGAHVTAGGVWTNASSRELKENIRNLTGDEAARTLFQLAPKRYNYKAEKSEEYLGFIAEDVPELVATGNRKSLSPMDIVAVLTKVVQEQQKKIAELETRLNSIQ